MKPNIQFFVFTAVMSFATLPALAAEPTVTLTQAELAVLMQSAVAQQRAEGVFVKLNKAFGGPKAAAPTPEAPHDH